jgi:hypothetical protein
MGTTRPRMPACANHLAVLHHDASHAGVRGGGKQTLCSQGKGLPHVRNITVVKHQRLPVP